jgi:formylglycine-generating enzyme required for sulfatase activity
MVRVQAAKFVMGVNDEGKGDRPAHGVTLTRAFYMDRTEVSVDAWNTCVGAGTCTQRTTHLRKAVQNNYGCNSEKDRSSHPANCVDRMQAAAYCAFVKKRLPTEAEWELAARGTDQRPYPWGTTGPTTCAQAVASGMSGGCGDRKGTSPVGSAREGASPFGALDMAGNVWEWVADDYAAYPSVDVTNPLVSESPGSRGVVRGGSWDYGATALRVTYRLPVPADSGNASIGFRCAKDAD